MDNDFGQQNKSIHVFKFYRKRNAGAEGALFSEALFQLFQKRTNLQHATSFSMVIVYCVLNPSRSYVMYHTCCWYYSLRGGSLAEFVSGKIGIENITTNNGSMANPI